jgi:hypothetical protein
MDKKYKNQIINELLDNVLTIHILGDNGMASVDEITEDNIVSESMTLKQSILDGDNFKFGGCIASEFDIQLIDDENKSFGSDLVGKEILVTMEQQYPSGTLYPSTSLYPATNLYPGYYTLTTTWQIFVGTIDSVKKDDENKHIHNIVAYDPIAKLYQNNVSNKLYKAMTGDKATIKELLALCLGSEQMFNSNDFGLYENYGQFKNYWWEAEKKKNSSSTKITKGELLADICEINCGFGFYRPSELSILESKEVTVGSETYINQTKVKYGQLRLLRYGDDICGTEEYEFYESLTTDEQTTSDFEGIIFPYGGVAEEVDKNWENGTGILHSDHTSDVLGTDDDPDESQNYYDVSDNIIAWDYSSNNAGNTLEKANTFYNKLKDNLLDEIDFEPVTAVLDGRLWVEVGDIIIIKVPETDLDGNFSYDSDGNQLFTEVKSRVLSRTLTGIKALTDTIEAKGVTL